MVLSPEHTKPWRLFFSADSTCWISVGARRSVGPSDHPDWLFSWRTSAWEKKNGSDKASKQHRFGKERKKESGKKIIYCTFYVFFASASSFPLPQAKDQELTLPVPFAMCQTFLKYHESVCGERDSELLFQAPLFMFCIPVALPVSRFE